MSTGENPGTQRLWTPWRHAYVTADRSRQRPGVPPALDAFPGDLGCVFCNQIAAVDYAIAHNMPSDEAEAAVWLLERGPHGYLVLNAFPYNNGHVMAVPYIHQDSLAALPLHVAEDLLRLARRAERALRTVYHPHGLNIGLNLGEAAGAGIAQHLHLHAVPRWNGDNNFLAVLADTRTLPEMLHDSWQRLRTALAQDPFEKATFEAAPQAGIESFEPLASSLA
ncbi:HIT domain-containing protein [Granulicella sp. 5B5]|nr:HIT domain-containing protein [Granulicella sp. 5B5]